MGDSLVCSWCIKLRDERISVMCKNCYNECRRRRLAAPRHTANVIREPESPSSWVLIGMVPFFLALMVLAHLFFRRATAPQKPISRGTRIVRKKSPTRIIYEL